MSEMYSSLQIRLENFILKLLTGSCTEACTVLSSGTASPYSRSSSGSSLLVPNSSCTCQCNFDLPIFREDLHICVNDIYGKWNYNFPIYFPNLFLVFHIFINDIHSEWNLLILQFISNSPTALAKQIQNIVHAAQKIEHKKIVSFCTFRVNARIIFARLCDELQSHLPRLSAT